MVKRLTRHGNSMALVIDKGVLDLLKITEKTPLDISTDGRVLLVAPVEDPDRRKAFEKALAQSHKKFGRVYKRLAQE